MVFRNKTWRSSGEKGTLSSSVFTECSGIGLKFTNADNEVVQCEEFQDTSYYVAQEGL